MDIHQKEKTKNRDNSSKEDDDRLGLNVKKKGKQVKNEKPIPTSFPKFWENNTFKIIAANCLILTATIFYIITLTGCSDSQAECLKNFDQTTIKYFALVLFLSGFLYTLIYTLAFYRIIHYAIPIYTTALIWYLCYVYDTGFDLANHGSFNRVFLFVIMAASLIIQYLLILTWKFINKVGIIKGIVGIVLLFLIGCVLLHFKLRAACSNWSKGLLDSELDNSVPGCKIKVPNYCWMNLMNNVFDVSGWLGENCEQIRMDNRNQLLRWTRVQGATVIGYPRVEDLKWFPDSTLDQFQFRVLGSIIDMNDPNTSQKLKDKTEIMVDFTTPHPEMKIRVVRDEKLVAQRAQKRKSIKDTFITKNVIHFFIDSLSRDNFKRKLPKAFAWLEKYYRNEKSDAKAYQFFKYHAVASWTIINMIPTTFGVNSDEKGSPPHSVKYYKDKGYITANIHNYCSREFFDIEPGNMEKYRFESFDHDANLIGCDPNFTVPGHPFAVLNGPYGMKRRCMYGKDTSAYVFDYAQKFLDGYKDEPKYLRMAFIDAHEGTGEVVKYMDDRMLIFFEFLETSGRLKDTTIVLQADHGVNMPGFYTFINAEDFWIEKTLPALYLIVPQEVSKQYDKLLTEKEQMLLSPYDLHNTFLQLAGAPTMAFNKVGSSLFDSKLDHEERNCDRFKVMDPYCNCIGERDASY